MQNNRKKIQEVIDMTNKNKQKSKIFEHKNDISQDDAAKKKRIFLKNTYLKFKSQLDKSLKKGKSSIFTEAKVKFLK